MIFVTKRQNHQLWLRPAREQRTPTGWLSVDDGLLIEFSNGLYETNDQEIVEALRKHPEYGLVFKLYDGRLPSETDLTAMPMHHIPIHVVRKQDGRDEYTPIPFDEKRGEPKEPIKIKKAKQQAVIFKDDPEQPTRVLPPKKVGSPTPLSDAEIADRVAQGKRTFTCPVCGEKFKSNIVIRIHKDQAHRSNKNL